MKTAWLRKYPKLPGAARFQAYYVMVEVVREEEKIGTQPVYEFVDDAERTAAMGFPCQRRIEVRREEYREAGFVVREKGGRPKWVQACDLFDRDPHRCDPAAVCG
jgi:hypothetical protein